jgi:Raf kinase inhibitor-like YbhB/YbcL family protein
MARWVTAAAILAGSLAAGCAAGPSTTTEATTMSDFSLSSPAFVGGGEIPARHTCDGPDLSPPLAWSGAPDGTAGFALVVDDPDAAGFVHWVAFDVPGEQASLAEGASGKGGFGEGRNGFGRTGWGGPCPPSGSHRYVFELFALDRRLGSPGGSSATEVRQAVAGHVLGSTRLTGTYRRGG